MGKRYTYAGDTLRFDVIHGRCVHCGAPIYFSQTIDWEGNRVNSLHCWNGHYKSVEIDHLVLAPGEGLSREQIEEIMPFIGFIKLNDDPDGSDD
jgi:hypothetical protein